MAIPRRIWILNVLAVVVAATCARLGFWLMFLGFNLAFLPTSWRGPAPTLLTQPDVLLSGQAGTVLLLGSLTFIGGSLLSLWTLKSW